MGWARFWVILPSQSCWYQRQNKAPCDVTRAQAGQFLRVRSKFSHKIALIAKLHLPQQLYHNFDYSAIVVTINRNM